MVGGVQGLAEHRDELGAPLCPCRHYDDKMAEAKQGFWNCPCVPMRERKVKVNGVLVPVTACMFCLTFGGQILMSKSYYVLQECHCMLFLTEDNDFRGDDQAITLDEVIESTKGMSGVQQT